MLKKVIIFILIFSVIGGGFYLYEKGLKKENKKTSEVKVNEKKTLQKYNSNLTKDTFFGDKKVSVTCLNKTDLSKIKQKITEDKEEETVTNLVNTFTPDNITINSVTEEGYSLELYNSLDNSILNMTDNSKYSINDTSLVIKKSDNTSLNKNLPTVLTYLDLNSEESDKVKSVVSSSYNQFLEKFGNVQTFDAKNDYVVNTVDLGKYFIGVNITYDNGKDGKEIENVKIRLVKSPVRA